MTNRNEGPLVALAVSMIAAVGVWVLIGAAAPGDVFSATVFEPVPLDPNRAPARLLVFLPRIGPVRAQAIIDERRRGGPFSGLDDLRRVYGIGPATVSELSGSGVVVRIDGEGGRVATEADP